VKLKRSKGKLIALSFKILLIFSSIYLIIMISFPTITLFNQYESPPDFRIYITNDEDFKKYNFPGNGSIDNPYIIENFTIIETYYPIKISGVSKYFIIRNNVLGDGRYEGVLDISNVNLNIIKIYNNTFLGDAYFGSNYGIKFYKCSNILFEDNIIKRFFDSFSLREDCKNITIRNNIFKTFYKSIELFGSSRISINNNSFYLLNNPYYDYYYGDLIRISDSINIEINENAFHNSSIWLSNSKISSFYNNTINRNEIGFFKNLHNITIEKKYGQLYLINCSDSNIKNQKISNTNTAIFLINCDNCSLESSQLYSNLDEGLVASNCDNLTIKNCLIDKNMDGIYLNQCDNSIIQNCTISNNHNGLFISNSAYSLFNNSFLNNDRDIYIYPF